MQKYAIFYEHDNQLFFIRIFAHDRKICQLTYAVHFQELITWV